MTKKCWFTVVVFCGVGLFFFESAITPGGQSQDDKTLSLKTAHFKTAIVKQGKLVSLTATLRDDGRGEGMLWLDPNTVSDDGAVTLIGFTPMKITLKEIKDDEHVKKGRRLYEVIGDNLQRLLVIMPEKVDQPCWLVIVGTDAVQDVVEMRRR